MDDHISRINDIEERLGRTEINFAVIHTDFKQMNKHMESMAKSMERLADIQTDIKIIEERHNNMRSDINGLGKRITTVEEMTRNVTADHATLTKFKDSFWSILGWTSAGIVGGVSIAFILVVYYVAKNGGFE